MNAYEVTYIIKADVSEEDAQAMSEKFSKITTENGGQIVNVDIWGKRRLAYEINGNVEGTYVCMKYNSDVPATAELRRIMNLDENIVRSLFIRLN